MTKCVAETHVGTVQRARERCRIQENYYRVQGNHTALTKDSCNWLW